MTNLRRDYIKMEEIIEELERELQEAQAEVLRLKDELREEREHLEEFEEEHKDLLYKGIIMEARKEYEALQAKHTKLCRSLVEHLDKIFAVDNPSGQLIIEKERMVLQIQDLRNSITSHPVHKELLSRCLGPS